MRNRLKGWTVEDVNADVAVLAKAVDSDTGRLVTFVVEGCGLEHDEDGTWGMFTSFTIDGRLPTSEEVDSFSDELHDLIKELYTP